MECGIVSPPLPHGIGSIVSPCIEADRIQRLDLWRKLTVFARREKEVSHGTLKHPGPYRRSPPTAWCSRAPSPVVVLLSDSLRLDLGV